MSNRSLVLAGLLLLAGLVVAACVRSQRADVISAPVVGVDAPDEYHVQLPLENVADVMDAKLAHANALLEGLALEDFRQIEVNARALIRISREAGWRVHTTVAYGVFSDAFRDTAEALADAAARHDMDGVVAGYEEMTRSCMRCHSYLRREGLYRQMPGAATRGKGTRRRGSA